MAGSGALTHAGVKSAGSAMAFLELCELGGYVREGSTEAYRQAAREGLTAAHWDAVERQYKASLKEKMMFMPSRDQWLPFDVEPVACEQISIVSEQLMKNYAELAELEAD